MTKTNKLIKGTIILSVAGIIAKMISVLYKVPLSQLVGTEGIGYYEKVFPIYSLFTAASLVGIPNTISKMVAEDVAKGEYKKAHLTFRYALYVSVIYGAIISFVMIFFDDSLMDIFAFDEGTRFVLWGFAISPIFISITGTIRGYLHGLHIMTYTAISQITDNIVKVAVGITATYLLLENGFSIAVAVGGAGLGASVGMMIASFYLIRVYMKERYQILDKLKEDEPILEIKALLRKLIQVAIPVTIASSAYSIMGLVDTYTIGNRLMSMGYSEAFTNGVFGDIGYAKMFINVPVVISVSLIISVIPSISAANTKDNKADLLYSIEEAVQLALKLALPAAVGLYVLALPVIDLVFEANANSAKHLQTLSIALVFIILSQCLIGVLHGVAKYGLSLAIVLTGAVAKVAGNYILVNEQFMANGAMMASVIFYGVIALLSLGYIIHQYKYKMNVVQVIIKPIVAAFLMGVIVHYVYVFLIGLMHSNLIGTAISVIVGIVVYVLGMFIIKGFSEDEISLLQRVLRR